MSPGEARLVHGAWLTVVAPLAIAGFANGCVRTVDIPVPRAEGKAPWYLKAWLYRPEGSGPFPLAVINHGAASTAESRREVMHPFVEQSRWFVERGFVVVVPSRRGYAGSDGPYAESYGRCDAADYKAAGLQTARDIWTVIDFMSKQPFVDPGRVIVIGHSAGGFGALALASLNPPGVAAVINFAGGRGSVASGKVCSPSEARAAFYELGRATAIPSLWLYSSNDGYFPPSLSRLWYDDYVRGGGRAVFIELPRDELDGHQIFSKATSMSLWTGEVEKFLFELGLAAQPSPGQARSSPR